MRGGSIVCAALLTLAIGPQSLAQDEAGSPARPSPERVRRLLEVSGQTRLGESVRQDMLQEVAQAPPGTLPDGLAAALEAEANLEELVGQLTELYTDALDPEAVEAAIAFYETPAGKRLAAARGTLLLAEQRLLSEWAQAAVQRALARVRGGNPIEQLGDARRRGNEAAAIGALKTLTTAQTLFREADKDGNGVLDYAPDLAALGRVDLIDATLAGGEKHGYRFELCRSDQEPEFLWMAVASPLEPGASGTRCFAINHLGMIYVSEQPLPLDREKCELEGGTPLSVANNEASARGGLGTIATSQSLFREGDKDGNGLLDYAPDLAALLAAQLVDGELGSGEKWGYRFEVRRSTKHPEFMWAATASPIEPGVSGTRWYAINQAGEIHARADGPIEVDPETCELRGGEPIGR